MTTARNDSTAAVRERHRRNYERLFAGSMALFVTFVVLTNTVGVKLFTVWGVTLPVSITWYPLTFLITDIVSEIYGSRRARYLVLTGFGMSVVLLIFSQIGIALPAASFYPLEQDYRNIFGPVWRLLAASMAAYLLAQLVDVQLFHFWKRLTRGRHLWLRNNGSTMVSQLVDTFVVNTIFLYGNSTVFTGTVSDLLGIIVGAYLFKIAIAAADTPLCYLAVRLVGRATGVDPRSVR